MQLLKIIMIVEQEWDELFSDIQVMEGAALKQMSENRAE
jgi:hypothetical protein